MPPDLSQTRSIFDQVADLPAPERPAALDRLCGSDAALRREVESLLASHETRQFLSSPTVAAPTLVTPRGEGPGTVIGPYKLLQMIGEGGFGMVYMAEQERPVRRKVALKIIKLGMDTRQVIARFEAERQALAMMEHPNIAKVLDAGATELGRPYFVMELVRGIPITEYCDTNKLGTGERLGLFMQVCHAVQHAHQKGVIHRDIKPGNVLVTLHDGRPVPKVIDFGIAKATSHRLTDKTLFTEFRQFIGTPEYMSPEQAEMSGLDVDTRSDIYSLGVLLYELLTGTTPFDGKQLRGQAVDRIQRMIRESEPPRPSTRVDTLAATPGSATTTSVAEFARQRRTDAAGLGRLLRGDLDWIVMRAIEKDRTRRYETATALAADVQRHLDDEPVEAGPPRATYRLRKFIKRNRMWLLPSAIGAAAFAVAFVGVVYGFVEASSGRTAAVHAQREAESARAETAAALESARRESERNRMVGQYLQDAVSGTIQRNGSQREMPLSEVLERGRSLFGGDHAVIASALLGWASYRQLAGDAPGAEPALEQAAEMLARMHGPGDPRVSSVRLLRARAIATQTGREAEAEDGFRAVVEATSQNPGERSLEHATALEALKSSLVERAQADRREEVAMIWGRTIAAFQAALGPTDRRTVREMATFGQWLQLGGMDEQAIPVLESAITHADGAFPDGDPSIYMAINSMVLIEWSRNRDWEKSVEWYDRMLVLGDRLGGEFARAGVAMRLQVAGFHAQAGHPELAVQRLEEFLAARQRPGFDLDWSSASRIELSMDWLSQTLDDNPDLGRRVQLARAQGADRATTGMSAPPARILESCGRWLAEHGFDADAEATLVQSVATYRAATTGESAGLGRALAELGRVRVRLGKFEPAEAALREALVLNESNAGAGDPATVRLRLSIAECLIGRERYAEAHAMLEAARPGEEAPLELRESHTALVETLRGVWPGP